MATYIALLRGINVGGKHSLPMSELKEDMQSLGCKEVRTYIQSGNVVFQCTQKSTSSLANRIAKRIEDRKGFCPDILILTAKQLQKAMDDNPFPEAEAEPKSLHLAFLASVPKSPDMNAIQQAKAPTEKFQLTDRVFYLHAPDGIGRSKLSAKIEKLLGVWATGRNWRTVQKLREMLDAP